MSVAAQRKCIPRTIVNSPTYNITSYIKSRNVVCRPHARAKTIQNMTFNPIKDRTLGAASPKT